MAKSDLSLSFVDLSPVYRKPGKPSWLGDKPIHGFDTETADGSVFCMSVATVNDSYVLHRDGGILEPSAIFEELTSHRHRGAVCVWYNLDFDANVILSALPDENIVEVVVTCATEWNGYSITYIPSKCLIISDPHKHKFYHFDVSQFFFGSLQSASKSYLGEGKANEGIDTSLFGLEDEGCNSYIMERFKAILHYARKDAELVKRLWEEFASKAEALNVPCGKPYSTGYLAEQTLNVRFGKNERKPQFGYRDVQEIAWKAYKGGRFEITERGNVGEVRIADINSAYPDILRKLPDPGGMQWTGYTRPKLSDLANADYGFIRVKVWTDPNAKIQPFAVKKSGKLYFPILEGVEVTEILPTFLWALSAGIVVKYEIEEAWVGRQATKPVYPFGFLTELFDERKKLKDAGKEKEQMVLKIIINSVYGKTAQLTDSTFFLSEDAEENAKDLWMPVELYPEKIQSYLAGHKLEIRRKYRAGNYFNPVICSYVTGLTRLKLLECAHAAGILDSVIMLATDSVMVKAKEFDNSPFLQMYGGKGLGEWDVKGAGNAFVVGSGIYELVDDSGNITETRSRGFEPNFGVLGFVLPPEGLLEAAKLSPEESTITIVSGRPVKMGHAVYQGFSSVDVGAWRDFPRSLTAGMDSKRVWGRGKDVVWRDLLEGVETSLPKKLDSGGWVV